MDRLIEVSGGYRRALAITAAASLAIYAACSTVSTPERVDGPAVSGNQVPVLTILEPSANLTIGQGATFIVVVGYCM